MYSIMTRTAFCKNCYSNDFPQSNKKYVVFCGNHKKYLIKTSECRGIRGFTPHIFQFERMEGDIIFFFKNCSFCGVVIDVDEGVDDKGMYKIYLANSSKGRMTTKEWKALHDFKDDTYWV